MKKLSELTLQRVNWLLKEAGKKKGRVSYNRSGKAGFQVTIVREIKHGTLFHVSSITPEFSQSVWGFMFIVLKNAIADDLPIYPVKLHLCEVGTIDLVTWNEGFNKVDEIMSPAPQYDSALNMMQIKIRNLWADQKLPLNIL